MISVNFEEYITSLHIVDLILLNNKGKVFHK